MNETTENAIWDAIEDAIEDATEDVVVVLLSVSPMLLILQPEFVISICVAPDSTMFAIFCNLDYTMGIL